MFSVVGGQRRAAAAAALALVFLASAVTVDGSFRRRNLKNKFKLKSTSKGVAHSGGQWRRDATNCGVNIRPLTPVCVSRYPSRGRRPVLLAASAQG